MEVRCQHHALEGRQMEEEILISGWHSCTVLMVLMVKERRALVEGRDVEQWNISSIGLVMGCGRRGRSVVFRSAFFCRSRCNHRLVAGRGGQDRFVGTWLMRGDRGGGGNQLTLFIAFTNGCQRSIMFDISIQL